MLPSLPSRFELLRSLGEGGMGVVYEAFDSLRGETVALKTLRHADADAVYRLKREFRSLANLEHPNLVRLYDLFADGERCFFTMELVKGTDLLSYVATGRTDTFADTLREGDPLAFDEGALRNALSGLASGLGALHGAGLLHRDLKPSNVLVTRSGRVVLLDFGLVADAHAAVQQTRRDAVTGTIAYMAPEQARGEVELTTAVDLYALGVVLFELLTKQLPFQGHALQVMLAKQTKVAPRPSEVVPLVPPDLDELASRLLERDPVARAKLVDVFEALGRSSSRHSRSPSSAPGGGDVLFGREAELATLDEVYRKSHEGRPSVALVRGRSGIGKSALLTSFARRAERAGGAVVLAGRCYEWETVPYKGLDGVVDALSRHLAMASPEELGRLLPPDLGDLATVFPVLRRIRPIASAYARRAMTDRPVHRIRAQGFACLREMLRRIGEVSPLVVVVDDVQWADEDTARGLVELLRDEHPPAMFLLLGARPNDESPVFRDLFGSEVADSVGTLARTTVELQPLADEAMRKIALRELGDDQQVSLVNAIVHESHGLPFAAGELVRFIRDGDTDFGSLGTVGSIDDLITRRASSLDPMSRRVLDVLAIAGEPTGADIVLRAAGLPEGERSAIDVLRTRHWVRTVRVGTGTLLDTAHDRIREAIVSGLSEAALRTHHHDMAIALEGLESPPHDRLVRHFAFAGESTLLFHHALRAAERAKEALAFRRAAELYEMALLHAPEAEAADLRVALACALSAAGRYQDASMAWLEAADLAPSHLRRDYRRRAAETLLHAGRIDDGLSLLSEVATELGVRLPEGRVGLFWALIRSRLQIWWQGLRYDPLREDVDRAHDRERVRTLGALALEYSTFDPVRGVLVIGRYLAEALRLGNLEDVATALGLEGFVVSSILPSRRKVELVLARLDGLRDSHAAPTARVWTHLVRGFSALHAGDIRAAYANGQAAISLLQSPRVAASPFASVARWASGFAYVFRLGVHDLEALSRYAEEREQSAGPAAELRLRAAFLPVLDIRLGCPERVHRVASEAFWAGCTRRELLFRTHARNYGAWAHLYEGDDEAAMDAIRESTRAMRRNGSWRVAMSRATACMILASCGVRRRLPRVAREAVRRFGRPKNGLERIYALWVLALAELADGQPDRFRRTLEELRELGRTQGNELAEVTACFGIGRTFDDSDAQAARKRFVEVLEGSGIVDPDRFIWSRFPVGEPPPRRKSTTPLWAETSARVD